MDVESALEQAAGAIRQGNKRQAQIILAEVIRQEPRNETAWLLLADAVERKEHAIDCLERVLKFNPNSQIAREGLTRLRGIDLPPALPQTLPKEPSAKSSPITSSAVSSPSESVAVPHSPIVRATKKCPYCAEEILAEAKICRFCGHDLERSTAIPAISSSQPVPLSGTTVAPKRKGIATAWIVLGILSGILVLGVGVVGIIAISGLIKSPDPTITSVSVAVTTLGNQAPPATPKSVGENTPTRVVPTSTPKPSLSCQPLAQDYLDRIRPLMIEFGDTVKVADSTSRIALGPVIQDMQRIKRDIADVSSPSCAEGASNLVVNGMDSIINAFIDFMGDVSDTLVQRKLSQGFLDLTNGTDQLIALASGQATPVPQKLPTNTPIPTPLPTPTPLPAGSSMVIDDSHGNPWQIKVTKVLVADTLKPTFSDSIEKAAGRFIIVFMEVTNRGLSPETFVAFGTLDVRDASGQRYEEHIASNYAWDIYGTDICADINPDETKSCVTVYDVSRQSSFYLLVPGTLADPYAPRILLDVP